MKLYCDGGHSKQSGKDAWGSVTDEYGNDLLCEEKINDMVIKVVNLPKRGTTTIIVANFPDVKAQQNNGAELLSMIQAMRIALRDNHDTICSDSDLVVKYWSTGHISPSAKLCEEKRSWIKYCGELRKEFESKEGKIVKISGKDNPADLFGAH